MQVAEGRFCADGKRPLLVPPWQWTWTLRPNADSIRSTGLYTAPASASLTAGQTRQFAATVTGASDTNVAWSLSPNLGSIDRVH